MGMKPRAKMTPLRRLAAGLRARGLRFPEAYEDFPWGERVLKVRKKVFVFLGSEQHLDSKLSFSVKLPVSGQALLAMPFATPTGYGLGKSGWVSIQCTAEEPLPLEMMLEWLEESYRAVAPKKLAALLASDDA